MTIQSPDFNTLSQPATTALGYRTVVVNGHRTTYLRDGKGPPLVLLHGYAGASWNWEYQIEALAPWFTVFVPDLLGQGLSQKPRIDYAPSFYIEWLRGFLDAVGVERAHLIGNSMGCGLALGMALTHPERVERLVLISGFPGNVLDKARGPYLRMFARIGSRLLFSLAYRCMGRRAFRTFLRGIVRDPSQVTPAVVERAYRLRKDHGKAWPLWSSLRNVSIWNEQYAPRLGMVNAPTLIIWGREDRFFPWEVGEELRKAIPGSKLAVVPHAGHLPMWEQPEVVNTLILEFLSA